MLGRRLASAAVIISFLIGLIFIDHHLGTEESLGRPGIVLAFLAVVVAMIAADEYVHLFKEHESGLESLPHVILSGIAVTICSLPVCWRNFPIDFSIGLFGWSFIALTVAVGMTWLLEINRFSDDGSGTRRIGLSILVYVQLLLLFGSFVAHRLLFFDNDVGMIAVITLIATVKSSDAAAYFAGKSFGKNKLSPRLSPGKTVEGFLGGFFGAILGTLIVVYLVAPFVFKTDLEIGIGWVVLYATAVNVAGVIGDLSESMLKRDAKIKDSSSWLPGLGGVLDVIDSLIFAAPLSYFLWILTK
ncbi:MAG: phosphatidate cytidylyltransferase [Planctomycetota bacterium]